MSPNNLDHIWIKYHMGEGTRARVTEPKVDQFSGRNLGMIPKSNQSWDDCLSYSLSPSFILHVFYEG